MRERQGISKTWLIYVVFAALIPHVSASASKTTELKSVVWKLESTSRIGGYTTTIVGSPHVAGKGRERALCFDGASDGIFLPANPIAEWDQFTIEALIKPDGTGPDEQRFIHIQDERDSRLLLETRLTPNKEWALDTFLFVASDVRLTLLDRDKPHPTDQWHWVALTFDGQTMSHYVNGIKELEGKIAFRAMTSGRMSIGVRLNKVSWYKGCIREIRFTPSALREQALQKKRPR